jgi:benzoyl-CoA reductase/2-hydroxyglutaryl-CoA dehydratase subunit BcrC/BadD/HgdB
MKRSVLLTASIIALTMAIASPALALSDRFNDARQETINRLSDRFNDARQETINRLSDRFNDARQETINR